MTYILIYCTLCLAGLADHNTQTLYSYTKPTLDHYRVLVNKVWLTGGNLGAASILRHVKQAFPSKNPH